MSSSQSELRDPELERVLALALRAGPMDVSRITVRASGCTVLLEGCLANRDDRLDIIECVMTRGIVRVIDAMTFPGETPEVYIYFASGSGDLRDAMAGTYDTRSTWQ